MSKPVKNRWRIETGGAASVTVTYRVYGREMTVRNNWVESAFAMLNGAPTFITLADRTARAHEVRLKLPAVWRGSATPLMPVAGQAHSPPRNSSVPVHRRLGWAAGDASRCTPARRRNSNAGRPWTTMPLISTS